MRNITQPRTILAVVMMVVSTSLLAQTHIPPHQREGAEHASQALQFFELLHSVPEGYNWRLVNRAVRDARVDRLRKGADQVQEGSVSGSWRELGSSNQCGRIIGVDYDPQTDRVWVVGAGGTIWAGDVNGTAWTILNETQQIDYPRLVKHVQLPGGGTRLLAVGQSPRSYWLDPGETIWQQAAGQEDWQRWGSVRRAVACTRNGRLEIYLVGNEWDYGSAWKGRGVLYRSIDSGASYQRLHWFDGAQALWTDGVDNVLLIHGDTLSSVDTDGTLQPITVSATAWAEGTRSIMMAGSTIDELMLALYDGSKTLFKLSDDGGLRWEETGEVDFGPFHTESFGRTTDPSATWLFGGVEAWRGDAIGYTWTKINNWGAYYTDPANKLHADIPAFASFTMKDGKGLTFICTDGGIYTTIDGGKTVRNISMSGLNTAQYYGSYTSRDNVDVVGAGAQDQGFQRSRVDPGQGAREFDQLISGDYARLVSGDNGRSLWCVYPGFTLYWPDFENGGARVGLDFVHRQAMWLPPLAVDPRSPYDVYLGGGRGADSGTRVYKYHYEGSTLSVDSLPHDFGNGTRNIQVTAITIAQNAPDTWYVVTSEGAVWASATGGATWQRRSRPDGLDGHYFGGNALATDPRNAGVVYIGGQGYNKPAVWVSADGAENWTPLEGLPPCLVLGLDVSSDGRLVAAATDAGAYIYDTESQAWTDVTALGAPDQNYWHVEWVAPLGQFRFSTYGRGLWSFTPGALVGVHESDQPSYRLDVDGVLSPHGAAVRIVPHTPGAARLQWYDADGRLLAFEVLELGTVPILHVRPRNLPPGSMVVVTDASGRVGGAVTP